MIQALPERTPEQIASASLDLVLGGRVHRVPVLPIRANREWTALFTETIQREVAGVGSVEGLEDVSVALGHATDALLDLLVAYDRSGVLGGREGLEDIAAPTELWEAFKQVTAAAFPFGVDLAKVVPELRMIVMRQMLTAFSEPTNISQQPTAGRRRRSNRN